MWIFFPDQFGFNWLSDSTSIAKCHSWQLSSAHEWASGRMGKKPTPQICFLVATAQIPVQDGSHFPCLTFVPNKHEKSSCLYDTWSQKQRLRTGMFDFRDLKKAFQIFHPFRCMINEVAKYCDSYNLPPQDILPSVSSRRQRCYQWCPHVS